MSFVLNKKVKIPSEQETQGKFIVIAQQIGCYNEVISLLKKYYNYERQYVNDPVAKCKIAENFIQDMSDIDLRLVAWLFDENNEIRVNNKVILKLVDDGT